VKYCSSKYAKLIRSHPKQCPNLRSWAKSKGFQKLQTLMASRKHRESDYIAQIQCHDSLNRLIELRSEDAYGTVFSKETYVYDRLGNQTLTTKYDSESTFAVTQTQYNSQGRPTAHSDAMGNITHVPRYYPPLLLHYLPALALRLLVDC